MSTLLEVTGISIDADSTFESVVSVSDVTITNAVVASSVTISNADEVPITTIEVPGRQGPPGVQNLFVSPTPPQNPKINDIWIQI